MDEPIKSINEDFLIVCKKSIAYDNGRSYFICFSSRVSVESNFFIVRYIYVRNNYPFVKIGHINTIKNMYLSSDWKIVNSLRPSIKEIAEFIKISSDEIIWYKWGSLS